MKRSKVKGRKSKDESLPAGGGVKSGHKTGQGSKRKGKFQDREPEPQGLVVRQSGPPVNGIRRNGETSAEAFRRMREIQFGVGD